MAFEILRNAIAFTAASNVVPQSPVKIDTAANRQVVLAASVNDSLQGFVGGATAKTGEAVTVYGENAVVSAVAAASLGAGAVVGVASTNGAIGPVSGASGVTKFQAGISLESAAAGEQFSLYVKPRQISNLI